MNLTEIEAFLAVAEELHFGRAAERLYLSQPRVSRLIASLEGEVGGALFDRTSRKVRITPLGEELRGSLAPSLEMMREGITAAKAAARGTTGTLRIGFTPTTFHESLGRLARSFEDRFPDCEVVLREISFIDPYGPLRRGELDVVVNWLAVEESDLTVGPTLTHQGRVLAVSADHPLAFRQSVSIEEVGGQPVGRPVGLPRAIEDAIIPPATPSGRPIPRVQDVTSPNEIFALVARGKIVHPTVESMIDLYPRPGVRFIPIRDMPPLPLGLIWLTSNESARIRALADLARAIGPKPTRPKQLARPRARGSTEATPRRPE